MMMQYNVCPLCGENYERRCKCPLACKECKNGHKWHTCVVHNNLVMGEADHSLPTYRCRCMIGDTEAGKYTITPKAEVDRCVGEGI